MKLIQTITSQPSVARLFIKPNLVLFFSQFSILYNARINLQQCLNILAAQQTNYHFKQCLISMSASLQLGINLTDIFREHPHFFDNTTCQLIKLGQHSGQLEKTLQQILSHHQQRAKLTQEATDALTYPIIIFISSILIFSFLLHNIVPKFQQIYQATAAPLPSSTQYLFLLSSIFNQHLVLICIIFFILTSVLLLSYKLQWLPNLSTLLYTFPLIKRPLQQLALANFSKNLQLGISAGLPLDQALALAIQNLPPHFKKPEIRQIIPLIHAGNPIHSALEVSKFFPQFYRDMIKTGEAAGNIETMLQSASQLMEKNAQLFLNKLKKAAEPLIMLGLGVVIGVMILSLYLPIFNLGNTI